MATPVLYPLSIYRGDSYHWQFTLWADAEKTEPIDLTGVQVAAELRQDQRVTKLAISVTDNTIVVTLSAPVSQKLPATTARWDLQLTYPSGDVQTIVRGDVYVLVDVTGALVT